MFNKIFWIAVYSNYCHLQATILSNPILYMLLLSKWADNRYIYVHLCTYSFCTYVMTSKCKMFDKNKCVLGLWSILNMIHLYILKLTAHRIYYISLCVSIPHINWKTILNEIPLYCIWEWIVVLWIKRHIGISLFSHQIFWLH